MLPTVQAAWRLLHATTVDSADSAPRARRPAGSPLDGVSARRVSRRRQLAALVIILVVGVTTIAGCTGNEPTQDTSSVTPAPSSKPADAGVDPTAARIDELVGDRTRRPTTATLPNAPQGFTNAEVAALAERAIDLVMRGVDPSLTKMSPARAFDYVFANQYPATTQSTRRATKVAAGRYDWEWAWASRFDDVPIIPFKFLTSRWQVETETFETSDGTRDEALRVILSVSIEHLVPDAAITDEADKDSTRDSVGDASVMRPIVVQRKVIVQGFEPLGGPEWWPGVGVQANVLFGGKCAPVNGSILTPATRPTILKEDLETFEDYVDHPQAVDSGNISDAKDLAAFVDEYCED